MSGKYDHMSPNRRSVVSDNLRYSLSFANRLDAPVWLREAIYRDSGLENEIDGDQIARTRKARAA